jgi:hypothetical protein
MPRRSNRFQRLITLINGVLGTDAHVVESAMLPDKIIGELREVDILISTNVSGYEVNIAIEVAGRRRRADTPWVESMHSKHSSLPTNKLVLVAESGFTSTALKKATFLGIEQLQLKLLWTLAGDLLLS